MMEKPKKERRFLKALGRVGEILIQEVLIKVGSSLIKRIGGKKTLPSILFLLASLSLFAQYPASGNKQRLGFQTTGDGLTWRGSITDTAAIQPLNNQNAWVILDTVNLKIYSFDFTSNVWNLIPQGTTFDTTTLNLVNRFALKLNISDTTAMLLPYAKKSYVDTAGRFYARQDFSNVTTSTLTWTQTDTLVPAGVNVVQVYRNGQILLPSQYTIPTKTSVIIAATSFKVGENYTVIFPKGGGGSGGGSGSLTSISGGTGITVSPNPITTTGTVSADLTVLMELSDTASLSNRINTKLNISDTTAMLLPYFRDADTSSLNLTSRFALKLNAADTASLSSRINTKGTGTVTSVATGYGLSGGTITTTGTLLLDSAVVFSRIRDSIVKVAIGKDTIKILKQEYAPATTSILTWTVTPKFPIQLKAYILVFRNGQLLINDQYNLTDTNKITIVSNSFKVGANYTVVTVSGIGSVGSAQAGNPVYPEAGIAVSTGTTWTTSIVNNSSNWNIAFNDKINNAAFTGTDTKTLTLTQYDGGTFTPTFTDLQGIVAADTASMLTNYLRTGVAASTYLTQANAASTYLPLAGGTLTGTLNGINQNLNSNLSITDPIPGNPPRIYTSVTTGPSTTAEIRLALDQSSTGGANMFLGGSQLLGGSGTNPNIFFTDSRRAYASVQGIYTGAGTIISGHIVFNTTPNNATTALTERMRIAQDGAITIGGTLGVTGATTLSAPLTVNSSAVFNEGSTDSDFRVKSDGNVNMVFVDASTDRVGIGTNAPSKTLEVNGTFNATGDITEGGLNVLTSADTASLSSRINGKVSLNGDETINGSKSFNNQVNVLNRMTISGSVSGGNQLIGKNSSNNGVSDITLGTGLSITSNVLNASTTDTTSLSNRINLKYNSTGGTISGAVTLSTTTATPTALLGKDGSNVVGTVSTVAQTGLFGRGTAINQVTDANGNITVAHGFGFTPNMAFANLPGQTANTVNVKSVDGTNIVFVVRDGATYNPLNVQTVTKIEFFAIK